MGCQAVPRKGCIRTGSADFPAGSSIRHAAQKSDAPGRVSRSVEFDPSPGYYSEPQYSVNTAWGGPGCFATNAARSFLTIPFSAAHAASVCTGKVGSRVPTGKRRGQTARWTSGATSPGRTVPRDRDTLPAHTRRLHRKQAGIPHRVHGVCNPGPGPRRDTSTLGMSSTRMRVRKETASDSRYLPNTLPTSIATGGAGRASGSPRTGAASRAYISKPGSTFWSAS